MKNKARYMAAATMICCLNIHQLSHAQNTNVEAGSCEY